MPLFLTSMYSSLYSIQIAELKNYTTIGSKIITIASGAPGQVVEAPGTFISGNTLNFFWSENTCENPIFPMLLIGECEATWLYAFLKQTFFPRTIPSIEQSLFIRTHLIPTLGPLPPMSPSWHLHPKLAYMVLVQRLLLLEWMGESASVLSAVNFASWWSKVCVSFLREPWLAYTVFYNPQGFNTSTNVSHSKIEGKRLACSTYPHAPHYQPRRVQ